MIHRIRIQNYKSLRDVTVELSPVTVLIGRSGTGKTNFCEAIRLLRDCLRSGLGSVREKLNEAKPATREASTTSFEVLFSIDGYDSQFRYVLTLDRRMSSSVREEFLHFGDKAVFHQLAPPDVRGLPQPSKWEHEPSLSKVPASGELALTRLPGLDHAIAAVSSLTNGIGVYAFPYDVLIGSKAGGNNLDDEAGNALGVIQALWLNLQNTRDRKILVSAIQQVNPGVRSIELDSIQSPKQAIVSHTFQGKLLSMPLDTESSGFRRFLAHLLALYQTPPKQTLIFEEPENGIFPGALATLADEFLATPDAGRGQVIFTTHSPTLLDYFDDEQIRVVELDEDLETQIGRLDPVQREVLREKLLRPGELFTVDTARREVVAQ